MPLRRNHIQIYITFKKTPKTNKQNPCWWFRNPKQPTMGCIYIYIYKTLKENHGINSQLPFPGKTGEFFRRISGWNHPHVPPDASARSPHGDWDHLGSSQCHSVRIHGFRTTMLGRSPDPTKVFPIRWWLLVVFEGNVCWKWKNPRILVVGKWSQFEERDVFVNQDTWVYLLIIP